MRVDAVAAIHQHPGTGHVAHVGVDLAREDREAFDTQLLRQLDLGIPIGALDQPDHDLAVKPLGQIVKIFDHRGRAAAVSLHNNPEAFPAFKFRVRKQLLDNIE